jgi:hypothetical protein
VFDIVYESPDKDERGTHAVAAAERGIYAAAAILTE